MRPASPEGQRRNGSPQRVAERDPDGDQDPAQHGQQAAEALDGESDRRSSQGDQGAGGEHRPPAADRRSRLLGVRGGEHGPEDHRRQAGDLADRAEDADQKQDRADGGDRQGNGQRARPARGRGRRSLVHLRRG
jgi:hypothetical protein